MSSFQVLADGDGLGTIDGGRQRAARPDTGRIKEKENKKSNSLRFHIYIYICIYIWRGNDAPAIVNKIKIK